MLMRHKRLSTTQLSSYTGLDGQLVVNRDHNTLSVMDGATPGGFVVSSQVTLNGPTKLKIDEPNVYTITNWSSFSTYDITAEGAEVTLEEGTLTITPPPESLGVRLSIKCDGVVRKLEISLDTGVFIDTWDELSKGPAGRYYHVATALNGKMYMLGGHTSDINRELWEYDVVEDLWTQLAPAPVIVHRHSLVGLNDKLYLLGLNPIRIYDVTTNTWGTASAVVPNTLQYTSTEVLDGLIYILGGGTSTATNSAVDQCWVYDPVMDTLTEIASLPEPRMCHSSFTVGRYIYVFGGYTPDVAYSNELLKYDPSTDSWSRIEVPENVSPRRYHRSVVVGSKAYIFGGETGSGSASWNNDLWEYDPFEGNWTQLQAGSPPRRWHSMASLDGAIYIFAGQGEGSVALDDLWRIKGRVLLPVKHMSYLTSDDYPSAPIVYNWASGESNLYSLTDFYTTSDYPSPVQLCGWTTSNDD